MHMCVIVAKQWMQGEKKWANYCSFSEPLKIIYQQLNWETNDDDALVKGYRL